MDRLLRDYGMIFVLLGLCIVFSVLTLEKQMPDSNRVADQILEAVGKQNDRKTSVLTVGSSNKGSSALAKQLEILLKEEGFNLVKSVVGTPKDLRAVLDEMQADNNPPHFIIPSQDVAKWRLFEQLLDKYPGLQKTQIVIPESYLWPNFLKKSNSPASKSLSRLYGV